MADILNIGNVNVCSVFDTYDYVIVAAVSSGSAMVSALCCIFVIGLIFLLKKQHFFIQRLILYYSLVALFRAIVLILRLHRLGYQNDSNVVSVLCKLSGFLDQVTLWYLLISFSVITFTLLMTAVFRKNVARLEGLYIFLIFVFPLTFNWIPFIRDSYGRNNAWCWVRTLNQDDCTVHGFGIILSNVLWNYPSYAFIAIMVPLYLIVIVFVARQKYCRRKPRTEFEQEAFKTLVKCLHEEVWPLLFLPLGVMILNGFPLINRIYSTVNGDDPSYALWMLQAIFSPLQGGYIALVYVLDRETLKRLSYSNIKAKLLMKKEKVQEYPLETGRTRESVVGNDPLSDYVSLQLL